MQNAFLKNQLFPKCSFLEKLMLGRENLIGKGSSSVDIFILNNSSTKTVGVPKSNCPTELSILTKRQLGRGFALEK